MRTNRRTILLAALSAVALVVGLAWWALSSLLPKVPDPVYDGHPLSYWVDPSAWPKTTGGVPEPRPAAGSLDSNAVPCLIQSLNRRDGVLRKAYNRAWPHLPGWLENRLPVPKYAWRVREKACEFLADLGVRARPAVPVLVRLLREDDAMMVRANAANALWRIASRGDQPAIEALIKATTDKDTLVRQSATQALKYIDPEAAAKAGIQ